ncbi:UPF0721 transmembrane protein [Marinobacterium nitratireducens]|uniref:Probable membrane transporter protein n=1 Tax=Marinobacterium nitratireducens TaxID=518897 RepID=A0A917ZK86_9GAMM|nr:sulfite exporter TauE/SafE family protein [Marinobacterium nitratireducens]GGO84539.1 UPF0721 transmembrane protein [Marinobacterium nitratireducens]
MIEDPLFYLVAIPAILIVGISKGGMGGGLGIVAVPMMSLVISPAQAAAILLPILCVMDLFALWGFRGVYDRANLRLLLPAAFVGIAVGTLTYSHLSEAHIKLIVGLTSLLFAANWLLQRLGTQRLEARNAGPVAGRLLGALAGFTSFSVHAGGPPVDMYLLPQRLDKSLFVGTTVIFFTAVNYAKLAPYAWLGLLNTDNLVTSLGLMILAPVGIRLGLWLHHRIRDESFYALCYALLLVAGLKLSIEGAEGLL